MAATTTAATAAAPQAPIRQSARRSYSFSSAKSPAKTPPVFSASKEPADWSESFATLLLSPSLSESWRNCSRIWVPFLSCHDCSGQKTPYHCGRPTTARTCWGFLGIRMSARSSLTVVLAAGEGTRMRSSLPKVLHPVAGQSLLAHVLNAAPNGKDKGRGAALAVVIGPNHQAVADEARRVRPDAATFIQHERLGTAHAVLAAREAIARGADDLLVAFGDTPLISAATFARLRAPLEKGAALAVLGFRAADPTGYGRLLIEGDRLVAIREHADASAEERKVMLCNAGVMAFDGSKALAILDRIGNANSKGEYYLVDAATVVREMGLEAVVIETNEDEVRGINTKAQLAEAESVMQARLRQAALEAGVTLIAPETVYLAADTTFGKDVTIEPFVVIGPGVSISDGAVIHSFSHIVQASIGKKASVGPYARLRPGTS